MGELFAKDYTGNPFVPFGTAHLAALALIAVANLSLFAFGRVAGPKWRRPGRYILGATILAGEISWHWWSLVYGIWDFRTHLPLHLCSVTGWLGIYMLFSGDARVYPFVYFLGIGGALQTVLTPDAGPYGFPHFRFLQTFLVHGALIAAGVYMTVVEGLRPTPRSIRDVILWTNIYLIVIFVFNQLTGSNYLFVSHKPESASLLDLFGPWPWYIMGMEISGLLTVAVLYAPFALRDWRPARAA